MTLARRIKSTTPAAQPKLGVGRPLGTDFFTRNPDVADAVEAILAHQRIAAPRVMELLSTKFDDLPHARTLRRFIAQLETARPALLASTRDPDLYKSQFRLALGRADGGVTRAHEVWELDTTKADVMTIGGRCMILGLIDRWSRRARFIVAPSESGQSVRRLLVSTIEAWGVMPECVATDNGSGYINASIRTALDALGIEHRVCPPGSPEKKPFVERLFGTFTRERAELLRGYAGHSVADAQRLRARARDATGRAIVLPEITTDELQAILDAWVDGIYHSREHSTLKMSPREKWLSSPKPAAAAPSRDRLVLALSQLVGPAIVGKRGIRWKNGRYWSAALTPFIGRSVEVRRDEDDLGALFIFDERGRFVDTAVNHHRAGLSEEAFAAAARAHQAEFMKTERARVRANQRAFDIDAARDALLRRDAEAAGKLVALPLPTEPRATPQLDSFDAPAEPIPFTERAAARVDQDAVAERVARAERLIADHAAGHEVDAQRLAWARAFVTGPAFRTHQAATRTFGDRNLRSVS